LVSEIAAPAIISHTELKCRHSTPKYLISLLTLQVK